MDGILLMDKAPGWTSNDVVQKVKRLLQLKKVGHAGTLDPMATGLLLLCLNKATKQVEALMDSQKTYEATLALGQATDTEDSDGQVIETQPVPELTELALEHVLEGFCGEIEQVPPMFSALKYKGKPLYRWAREGKVIERKPRKIRIYDLKLKGFSSSHVDLEVTCSKGTYVRSLVVAIAQKLGTVGHLAQLRRTHCGSYSVQEALTIERLEKKVKEGSFDSKSTLYKQNFT